MPSAITYSDDQLAKTGHRVLCIAFAAYEWDRLRRDSDPDPLDRLLELDEQEFTQELLKLSTMARANDDATKVLDQSTKCFPEGVGTLATNIGVSPLSPREACNKIIHAKSMKFEASISDKNPIWERWYASTNQSVQGEFKTPAILIQGEHFKAGQWQVRLELVPFVYAVALADIWQWNIAGAK